MSLLVTGSIGIDTVETPHGRVENVLGGSAIYFSLAAALFCDVKLVGVVGEDFDRRMLEPLKAKRIDISGIETRPGSKTFRWEGKYVGSMNEAETVGIELNVLAERGPAIPEVFRTCPFVFLANTHPALQKSFAVQMRGARMIVCDTHNHWIDNEPAALKDALGSVHGIVLNEGEARRFTGVHNLVTAGRKILEFGPQFAIIKKGEHGSLLVSRDDLFIGPPYPTENTVDPTGCGDTFAGALLGYLAAQGRTDKAAMREAMARGSVLASYVIESFSVSALASVTPADVEKRLHQLHEMARFQ